MSVSIEIRWHHICIIVIYSVWGGFIPPNSPILPPIKITNYEPVDFKIRPSLVLSSHYNGCNPNH